MQEPREGTGAAARSTGGALYMTPQGTMRGVIPVARVFEVIGSIMQRERGRLNMLDSFRRAGPPMATGSPWAFTQAGLAVRRAGAATPGVIWNWPEKRLRQWPGGRAGAIIARAYAAPRQRSGAAPA